jgi:7-cyano-7-deazaguanine synthase
VSEKKGIVLLSGGLDSTTTLAIALSQGFTAYALTFRYGQRHAAEIEAARKVAKSMRVAEHVIVDFDLRLFGGSALTSDQAVPKDRPLESMATGIPITYVPARNTIFLSFALAWAEVLEVEDIFLGVNAVDYSGYPDCRPEYLRAYEEMARLATKAGVEGRRPLQIHAPLLSMTKSEIVHTGLALGVDYSVTRTCYDPSADGRSCGHCDACLIRIKGFVENGISDPAPYQMEVSVSA